MIKIIPLLLLLSLIGCSHVSVQEHEALKVQVQGLKNQQIANQIFLKEIHEKTEWIWNFHKEEREFDAKMGSTFEAHSAAWECNELYKMVQELPTKGIKISIIMSDLKKSMNSLEVDNGIYECVEDKLKNGADKKR